MPYFQERLATLEAEISSREEEANTLRAQLAGMEGSMRESQEARINKTQAQVRDCLVCAPVHMEQEGQCGCEGECSWGGVG